jgi:insulin-like growth factor-binding protein complex acid labile subunit
MHINEISEITPGTFVKISHLEYLNLEYNRIEHLGVNVFYGLVNLMHIILERNKLQHLHPDTFLGLPNLQSLLLSKNSGLQIPTGLQFINSLSLKILRIAGCNIRSVSVETFANVSELEWLDLSYNYMSSLDINILKVLPKLSVLNLTRNEISEITSGTCEEISHQENLNLSYNMIENLAIDVFCGLVYLKYVDLEGNKLQYLHPDTFRGLPNFQRLLLSKTSGLQLPNDSQFINSFPLEKLAIAGCNIRSVSVQTFANISELEWLNLSYNYLSIPDIHILKYYQNCPTCICKITR